jgi:hypothetical protein
MGTSVRIHTPTENRGTTGGYMGIKTLFSDQDRDEIESAAEMAGISFEAFVVKCTLWVVYNFPEVADGSSVDLDRHYRTVV